MPSISNPAVLVGGLPAKLASGPRTGGDLAKTGAALGRGPNMAREFNAAPWSNTFPAPGATLDLDFANDRGFVRGVGQGSSMQAVTFTRASSANWVDSTGTLRTGAGSFTGSANALGVNLLNSPQNFSAAVWSKNGNGTLAIDNQITAPDSTQSGSFVYDNPASGNDPWIEQAVTSSGGTTYTFSVYIHSSSTATGFIFIWDNVGGRGTTQTITVPTSGWARFTITKTLTAGATQSRSGFEITNGSDKGFYVWGAQLEVGSTATTYYPTNINVPRFDWASTASTGAGTIADPRIVPLAANPTSNGLLIEEARTNRLLWCRDATNAAWVKTNVTAAKDQTGIDGVASAASSLTSTAANGTCIQTITLASGSRTGSVFLKRITGTGNVQVTLDGSTWSTVDLSSTEWRRIVLSGTVTNPTVGIRLAVNGDAVALDYGQIEDGGFATSPILTTTASVTRSADFTSMSGQNFLSWYDFRNGTVFIEVGGAQGVFVTAWELYLDGINTIRMSKQVSPATSNNIFDFRCDYRGPRVLEIVTTSGQGKFILSMAQDNTAASWNNFVSLVDTSVQFPMVTDLYLGYSRANGNIRHINTFIKRIYFVPKRLPNNALQVLTGPST